MLVDKPRRGTDRERRINAGSGAPGAERQAQLTRTGGDRLHPEVVAFDTTALAAHP
jgi:hypothetical protein